MTPLQYTILNSAMDVYLAQCKRAVNNAKSPAVKEAYQQDYNRALEVKSDIQREAATAGKK